jgi:transcriptional regulator with PAS, ATPase and Fis domain
MAQPLQAKLLRVLQDGVIEPVGSNRHVPVDVRIVSSTNRDLRGAIRDGTFREDLFYRLNVFHLQLPPLRQRLEDIGDLANAFLAQFSKELGKPPFHIADEALRALERYKWPGNVRELRNVMERAAVLAAPGEIPQSLVRSLLPEELTVDSPDFSLEHAVNEAERKMILRALMETKDNKAAAASILGIGERTLWTKLKKHGL